MDADKESVGEPARDPELIFNMREEIGIPDISTFLQNNNVRGMDPAAELPDILNMPLRLYRDENKQLKVLREHEDFTLEEVVDEFADGATVDLYSFMSKIFLIDGRIYKHYRLLPWFPKYFEFLYRSQLLIMDNNDGGEEALHNQSENDIFPKHINYYLAIMAVSLYQNEYLLCILQEQFLLAGGPLEWLIFGLKKVDSKLQRIAEFNEQLAFKPWQLTKEHFTNLIKGGENHNDNWTVHEVLKASIILSSYHGLCGLCSGMGLVPDLDIVQELLTLMGPEALELTISKE